MYVCQLVSAWTNQYRKKYCMKPRDDELMGKLHCLSKTSENILIEVLQINCQMNRVSILVLHYKARVVKSEA